MMNVEGRLHHAISNSLVPELVNRGFLSLPSAGDDRNGSEIRNAFPFGRFHRKGAEHVDMLELQFHKRSKMKFRINLGRAPIEGYEHQSGFIQPEEMWVHYLNDYCTVYRCPLTRTWFSAEKSLFSREGATDRIANAVGETIELLDEVDDFFASNKLGRHIRRLS